MKKNYSLILDDEFVEYCRINNIDDVEKHAKETFKKGFMLLKYSNESILKEGIHYQTIPMNPPMPTPLPRTIIKEKNNLYDE